MWLRDGGGKETHGESAVEAWDGGQRRQVVLVGKRGSEATRQVWLLYGKDRLSNQHPLTNKCVLSTYAGSQPHQGEL